MPPTIDPPIGETHFQLMRLLEAQPELSQRDLSRELGMSLGKVNYCLNALVDKGLVKVGNFRNNDNNEIRFKETAGRLPLEPNEMRFFKELVTAKSDEIVSKWIDFFVLHKTIKPERITKRLK